MNILVTGGAGFIGSHVAECLLNIGETVTVVDNLLGGFIENVPEKADFVFGDITDAAQMNALFRARQFDAVYHLAAYAAEGLSHHIKRFNYTNNLIGSVNLINASVNYGVKRFVFTSSIAVYGAGQLPMTEDMTPRPEDSYGIAKYAVEQELDATARHFGLDYTIFRPHNVYGTRQNIGDRYRNVIGIFMNQCMRHEPLTIFGDGTQTRAFTDIRDVAPVIARAHINEAARNQVYNIGADTPITVNEIAHRVRAAMDVDVAIQYQNARDEVLHAFSDHSKVRRDFEVAACSIPIAQGIADMAKWAKTHGARASSTFEDIEIKRGLPSVWRTVA